MKLFAFAFVLLIASASALPKNDVEILEDEVQVLENNDNKSLESRVSPTIRLILQRIRREIVAAGLDPFYRELYEIEHNVPFVANVKAVVESLRFTGLSNIVIRTMTFSVLTNRLRFDISLPRLSLSVGNIDVTARVLFQNYNAEMNGFLNISEIRLRGEARVFFGIISGVTVRNLDVRFSIGNITADIYAVALGENYSDIINAVLNELIPDMLKQYEAEINRIVTDLVRSIINRA